MNQNAKYANAIFWLPFSEKSRNGEIIVLAPSCWYLKWFLPNYKESIWSLFFIKMKHSLVILKKIIGFFSAGGILYPAGGVLGVVMDIYQYANPRRDQLTWIRFVSIYQLFSYQKFNYFVIPLSRFRQWPTATVSIEMPHVIDWISFKLYTFLWELYRLLYIHTYQP